VFGLQIVEQYAVQGIRRASGTFENGPRYAMFLLGPIAVALVALYRNLDGKRILWIGLTLLFGLGLMVSFTRAAITLGATYIFLYNVFERDWRALGKSVIWASIVLIVAAAIVFLLVPSSVTDAVTARFDTEGGDPYLDRFNFMYNALGAWSENPIIGLGVGTYTWHSWDMMQKYPVPWRDYAWQINPLAMPQKVPVHNDYARMLAETGIFSLISIILVFAFSFRNYFYVIRNSNDEFIITCAIGFAMYLGVMIPYWFVHEYIMMEAYTSMIPTVMSVILKNIVAKEVARREEKEAEQTADQPALAGADS
jgi:O-antigen ligase